MEACLYCGWEGIEEDAEVPAVDDHAAWARLADEHEEDCEWIRTRAHRVSPCAVACACGCPEADHTLAAKESGKAIWLCIGCLHTCPGIQRNDGEPPTAHIPKQRNPHIAGKDEDTNQQGVIP